MDVGRCLWYCTYWGVGIRRVADLHSLACDPVETPVRPHLQPVASAVSQTWPGEYWLELDGRSLPHPIPQKTKNKKFQIIREKKNPKSTQFLCGKMKNDVFGRGGGVCVEKKKGVLI
jgi:hypothetical protein